jgi:hypothetical protein
MLQSRQTDERFSFMESAKLVKTTGEPLRALQELENSMRLFGMIADKHDVIDLTDDDESKMMEAKVWLMVTVSSVTKYISGSGSSSTLDERIRPIRSESHSKNFPKGNGFVSKERILTSF